MAKTKEVYNIKVYFSKDDYGEWKDVECVDWPEENCIQFTDKNGEEVTINAPAQVIVVTRKEEVVARY